MWGEPRSLHVNGPFCRFRKTADALYICYKKKIDYSSVPNSPYIYSDSQTSLTRLSHFYKMGEGIQRFVFLLLNWNVVGKKVFVLSSVNSNITTQLSIHVFQKIKSGRNVKTPVRTWPYTLLSRGHSRCMNTCFAILQITGI